MICHDICKMFVYHKEGTKVVINEDKFVACGMCIWRCPNKNINLSRSKTELEYSWQLYQGMTPLSNNREGE